MYDAIVVGARCAGSPTAMLLARRGYRVLLVDRASFPSDTLSTHYIHIPGVLRLHRWGLLERVRQAGGRPIPKITLHLGKVTVVPPPPPGLPPGLAPEAYCPRRTVLDAILVDAAVGAGAELRERFSVRDLVWEEGRVAGVRGRAGGREVTERARLVIGADGLHSQVARLVNAPAYHTRPTLTFGYYTYWSDVAMDGAELHVSEGGGILAFPTNDGLTCVAVGGSIESFHRFRQDIQGNYFRILEVAPDLARRVRAGRREERFLGTADQPNYFRRPYGPGWALVGDAGYHRDFVTGLGITDAFRDAELLAAAADEGLSGRRPLGEALAAYERHRNEVAEPLYELTCRIAGGEYVEPAQWIAFSQAMARMIAGPVA
ncbi:MAG TPA: NAD(P)/FAD-dependent oxidoreductase [Dehalococcoidia bacterium]